MKALHALALLAGLNAAALAAGSSAASSSGVYRTPTIGTVIVIYVIYKIVFGGK